MKLFYNDSNSFFSSSYNRLKVSFNIHHFYSILIFLFLSFIVIREFVFGDFLFEYRDIVWPYDLNNLISEIIFTTNLDWTRRALPFLPFLSFFSVLDLSSILAEKIFFLMSRFFMGFFMYFVLYRFLSEKISKTNKNTIFFISLFAGFFYSFNPIATTFNSSDPIQSFSYALIPLVFYYFDKAINKGTFSSIFLSALVITLSIAAVQQFLILLPLLILVPWTIFEIIVKKILQKPIFPILKNLFFVSSFSFLLSLYWIFPALSILNLSIVLQPNYALTTNILNTFSSETSLLNVFRLLGDWWPRVEIIPIIDTIPWTVISFAIPLTLVSLILFLKKSRLKYYLLSFSIISLYIMFFHKGLQEPFSDFYLVLYDIPIIGWMFRVPTVMGQFVAFSLTIILSLGFYQILSTKILNLSKYLKYIPITVLIITTSVISWPMFSGDLGGVLTPQKIPEEDVNKLKNIQMTDSKFFFYPRDKSVHFDVPVFPSKSNQYIKFLEDRIEKEKPFREILSPINIQFFGLHNSINQSVAANELGNFEIQLTNYTLFENPDSFPFIGVSEKNLLVFGGLDKFSLLTNIESFESKEFSLIYADFNLNTIQLIGTLPDTLIVNQEENLIVQLLNEESKIIKPSNTEKSYKPQKMWSYGDTNDPTHGSFHNKLEEFGLSNWDFDYSSGLIFTWAPENKELIFDISKKDEYNVFVRYLENSEGGIIDFSLDDRETKKVNTKKQINQFVWKDIGKFELNEGRHVLDIKNVNGVNAINLLVIIPSLELENLKEQINMILKNKKIIYLIEAESDLIVEGRTIEWDFLPVDVSNNIEVIQNQITIPNGTTDMVIEFWTRQFPDSDASYEIKNLKIEPIYEEKIFETNSEKDVNDWLNMAEKNLDISFIDNLSDFEKDLKVEIISGTSIKQNIIKTDFIPVNEKTNLKYEIDLSSKDVVNFNSKVRYFDENKEFIKSDWILSLNQGSFVKNIKEIIQTPEKTRFIVLQFGVQMNPEKNSSFEIDNVRISQFIPEIISDDFFINPTPKSQSLRLADNSIKVKIEKNDGRAWNIIKTKPIPIQQDLVFDVKMDVNTKNNSEIFSKIIYLQNDNRKLNDFLADNGDTLMIEQRSKIFSEIEFLKNSNYTVGLRAMGCDNCSNINIQIQEISHDFSLHDSKNEYNWFYFTSAQNKGPSEIVIEAEKGVKLDSMIIYSDSYEGETRANLFSFDRSQPQVKYFEKINPTLFKIELIDSPQIPFILRFAEPYDPLWTATFADKVYPSIPLYSITNGFVLDDANETEIIIEYMPQKWFYIGSGVTSFVIIFSLVLIILKNNNYSKKSNKISQKNTDDGIRYES